MSLLVYSACELAGTLDMAQNEPFYGFTYAEGYLALPNALPLSISLPLRSERYDGERALPFFEGLLPEGGVRESVARQLHVSSTSPAQLMQL